MTLTQRTFNLSIARVIAGYTKRAKKAAVKRSPRRDPEAAKDLYLAYMRGWSDGAVGRPANDTYAGSMVGWEGSPGGAAYLRGHEQGDADRQKASRIAATFYQHKIAEPAAGAPAPKTTTKRK